MKRLLMFLLFSFTFPKALMAQSYPPNPPSLVECEAKLEYGRTLYYDYEREAVRFCRSLQDIFGTRQNCSVRRVRHQGVWRWRGRFAFERKFIGRGYDGYEASRNALSLFTNFLVQRDLARHSLGYVLRFPRRCY